MMNTSAGVPVNVHKAELLVLGGRVLSFLHQFAAIWGLQHSIEERIFW